MRNQPSIIYFLISSALKYMSEQVMSNQDRLRAELKKFYGNLDFRETHYTSDLDSERLKYHKIYELNEQIFDEPFVNFEEAPQRVFDLALPFEDNIDYFDDAEPTVLFEEPFREECLIDLEPRGYLDEGLHPFSTLTLHLEGSIDVPFILANVSFKSMLEGKRDDLLFQFLADLRTSKSISINYSGYEVFHSVSLSDKEQLMKKRDELHLLISKLVFSQITAENREVKEKIFVNYFGTLIQNFSRCSDNALRFQRNLPDFEKKQLNFVLDVVNHILDPSTTLLFFDGEKVLIQRALFLMALGISVKKSFFEVAEVLSKTTTVRGNLWDKSS